MEFNKEEARKKYAITDEQFMENAREIFGEISINASKTDEPKFIIVGGQAGSGKTGLVAKKYNELNGNAVIIDQDELRTKYPQEIYKEIVANHTDREEFLILNIYIAKMIKEIINRSREAGYSVILETAMQDIEAFIGYTQEFKDAGYTNELAVMSVSEVEGNISMLYRYCYYLEKDGECRRNTRINPNAINKLRENLNRFDELDLFDDIEVYKRGANKDELPSQIYSKKENKFEKPVEAFERGRRVSFDMTRKSFPEKYEYIKRILEGHNDLNRLETLEQIQAEFNRLDERE